jgi:hypothetical protein
MNNLSALACPGCRARPVSRDACCRVARNYRMRGSTPVGGIAVSLDLTTLYPWAQQNGSLPSPAAISSGRQIAAGVSR